MKAAIFTMLMAAAVVPDQVPKTPAEAIALANARVGRKTKGVFRMTVAATGHLGSTVFLNSMTDYRASDDLTFELTGSAARALTKQLGANPETALVGKIVTVRGYVEAVPIAIVHDRRAFFSRFQHRVLVTKAKQLDVEQAAFE